MPDKPSDPSESHLKCGLLRILVQSHSFAPCFLRRGAASRLKLSSLESSGSEIGFSPSPR
jgi:hypothetical protein